jgi:hypothetical protein
VEPIAKESMRTHHVSWRKARARHGPRCEARC